VLSRKLHRPKPHLPKLPHPRHRVSLTVAALLDSSLHTAKPHLLNSKDTHRKGTRRSNKDILRSNKDTRRSNKDTRRSNKDTRRSNKDTRRSNKDIHRNSKGTLRSNKDMAVILAKRLLRATINREDIRPSRDTHHRVDNPVSRRLQGTRVTADECSTCCCGSSRWRL